MEAMLIELFGVGWVNLIGNGVEDDSFGSVLGVLFGLFNAAVAFVTVAILLLLAVTAVADTAQTGQVMGRGGSMWVPIRAVVAAALLVPVVKGFSLLQVLILSLVVNFSVSLANSMASESLKYMTLDLGQFTDPIASQVQGVAEQVLYSSVCQNYYNLVEYDVAQGGAGEIVALESEEIANGLRRVRWSFDGDVYSGQGQAACGAFLVSCPDRLPASLQMCDEQMNALQRLKAELDPLAIRLINHQSISSSDIANASLTYQAALRSALKKRMRQQAIQKQREDANTQLVTSIEQNGFAFLGQWYMTIAAINQRNQFYAKATLDSLPIDQSKAIHNRLGIYAYLERTQSLLQLKSGGLNQTAGTLDAEAIKQREMAGILGGQGTLGNYLAQHAQLQLNGKAADGSKLFEFGVDPLTGLQQLGSTMVTLTTSFWSDARMPGAKVARSDQDEEVVQLIMRATNSISANGGAQKGQAGQQAHQAEIETFASYIMIILFLAGLTLMYYIPAVPFIVWTFAIVGYLILILEALIAAPLWAASHALPRGQGMASDASKQGYALLLNLAIRPPLMVLGLLAGGALMMIAAQFTVTTFDIYSASLLKSRVELSSLLTFVSLFVVEVMVLITVVHKSFALIFQASDKAVEWVTGQSRTGSDAADEQRTSGAASGAQRSGEAALGRASYSARSSAGSGSTAVPPSDPVDKQTFR